MDDLKEYLKDLPKYCRLIPLGHEEEYKHTGRRWINPKRPINDDWRNDTYNLEEVCKINKTGIGIVQGETGNGILCLDFDGPNSQQNFKDNLGIELEDLPFTVAWSSGTPHRHQRAFEVPKSEWSRLSSHNTIPEVEIKWTGQSVIAGFHQRDPDDEGRQYQWLDGCSPSDLPIEYAPERLIAAIEKYGSKNASKYRKRTKEELNYDSSRVEKYLKQYLQPAEKFSKYGTWLNVGMALHYLSQELGDYWLHFPDWVKWSFDMKEFDEDECEEKWLSFNTDIKIIKNPRKFGTIVALAKKHPKFTPSEPPKEVKEAKEDKPPRLYTELRQELYNALTNQEENLYQNLLSELRREFYKSERDIAPQLLKLMREKYSNKKLKVGAIDINKIDTLDYCLEGFLPAGEVVHLFSPWGCGKTSLTLGMIRALAEGTGFLDQEKALQPCKSLFIQSDAGGSRFKASYLELGMDEDPRFQFDTPESMLTVMAADIKQGTESWTCNLQGFEKLMRLIPELGVKAVFIDSVKGMTEGTGYDYASNEHVKALTKTFGMIADLYKVAIVLINHKVIGQTF